MPKYTIEKLDKMVCLVNVHLEGDERSFEVASMPDAHWDNPKCDRALLKEHLEYAKKKEALIVLPGDTFCLMQGKYDPRGTKSDIRPEHNKSNYLDVVVNDGANYFKPYSENMIIGQGNHESSILKRQETNILDRFAGAMGGNIPVMGYQFWVVLRIFFSGGQRAVQRMFFHHGYGGGGPVTRGAINHSRFLMQVEGADVISNGHIHEKTTGEVMVQYFDGSPRGQKAMARSVIIMQSSTYKQEFTPEGFHTERGRPPKPLGGTFITFHCSRSENDGAEVVKQPHFFGTKSFAI